MESGEDKLYLPTRYANINLERPTSYSNVDALKINWNSIEDYKIITKVGRGKYSEVFQGVNFKNKEQVCIKILKPVRKTKILREVKILQNLYGGPNIIKLHDVARDQASKTPCLVFEYIKGTPPRQLFQNFKLIDLQFYIFELLKALEYSHSNGIMHRDIKPQNIMFDHQLKELRVIDWGLAEFYFPNQIYNVRVASRYYKGPELLVDDVKYHYSLDIWSAGCTLAEIMFKKDPFFFGEDNNDQLIKISKVMGTDDLIEYLRKYNLSLSPYYQQNLGRYPKKNLMNFLKPENSHLVTQDGVDLLEKMLVYDRNLRISPEEAMIHPFFKNVRNGQYLKM